MATTINLKFTSGSLSNAVSSNIVVSSAAFVQLQLLAPGETNAPGTVSGKTGTPSTRTAGAAFNATVNAVDTFWNTVTNVTDTVDISSSDTNAVLPADAALVGGTGTPSVTLMTAGTATLTATDTSNPSKTNYTTPAITVIAGALAKLQLLVPGKIAAPGSPTGKTGSPLTQTAGAGFSVTVIAVDANWGDHFKRCERRLAR